MRTLTLQVQVTLDGFMAGPAGEQDWMDMNWSDDVGEYVGSIMTGCDTILLGRVLAEGFIPAWAGMPDQPGADFFNGTPRKVVSNTLETSPWENAEILSGDGAESVRALKAADGGTIIGYGGARLVSSLLRAGLVDDLHLFVNPVAIGAGMPVFGATTPGSSPDGPPGSSSDGPDAYLRYRTARVTPFDCGITAVHLQPAT